MDVVRDFSSPIDMQAYASNTEILAYTTVAQADAYLIDLGTAAAWFTQEEHIKALLLQMATEQIDELPCLFAKVNATQPLQYPVLMGNSSEGQMETAIACAIQALYLAQIHAQDKGEHVPLTEESLLVCNIEDSLCTRYALGAMHALADFINFEALSTTP